MIRIFLFLLLVLLLALGFGWFADRPGEVVLQWQGNEYETSLMVVLVGLVALIASVMIIWWLGRTILDSPQIMQRFFKARKKDRGYKALSQGLIAANSGDAALARRYTKESVKLLGREPLVDLLDAQSALLEGKREDARARFEEMLNGDETRLVALRGLYLEAERQGAREAARHYAEEANKEAPALPWAGNAKLRYASLDGDWEGALKALEANKSAGLIEKDAAKRQRAVLLTAMAMAEEPADPVQAAKHAREAHKLAPTLVPAAVIGAKALARNSDIGRAAGMIETVWKKEPHPDLAASYIHLRIGDSAADRLKRAKKLAKLKPNHPEGSFAIAEAAVDAQDWKLARESLKPVLTSAPSERACLLMAEIEEGEFGDKGRMRDWLSRAVRSPKDAAWTADGYVSDKWLPISPVSGRIDAFEWKVPVEQLGAPDAAVLDAEGLEDLIREPEAAPFSPDVPEGAEPKNTDVDNTKAVAGAGAIAGAAEPILPDADPAPEKSEDQGSQGEGGEALIIEADTVDESPTNGSKQDGPTATNGADPMSSTSEESTKSDVTEEPAVVSDIKEISEAEETASSEKNTSASEDPAISDDKDDKLAKSEASFILDRRPDDPGVREKDREPKPKRFGLF